MKKKYFYSSKASQRGLSPGKPGSSKKFSIRTLWKALRLKTPTGQGTIYIDGIKVGEGGTIDNVSNEDHGVKYSLSRTFDVGIETVGLFYQFLQLIHRPF